MERDDIIEYSLEGHHSEEAGQSIRKKIYFVTILLSVITAVEVAMGALVKQGSDFWTTVKWSFIILTIVKAYYIVKVFMHLGDERKAMRYVIIIPYMIFMFYMIFIFLTEGTSVGDILTEHAS